MIRMGKNLGAPWTTVIAECSASASVCRDPATARFSAEVATSVQWELQPSVSPLVCRGQGAARKMCLNVGGLSTLSDVHIAYNLYSPFDAHQISGFSLSMSQQRDPEPAQRPGTWGI